MTVSLPRSILRPFADQSALKFNIPDTYSADPADAGKASYSMGFPNETMIPIGAGGTPPFGQDMNGILYDITGHLAYLNAGKTYKFSQEIANAGGYPFGAILAPDDDTLPYFFRSGADNNTINFNDGSGVGALWLVLSIPAQYSDTFNYTFTSFVFDESGAVWQNLKPNGPNTDDGIVRPGDDENYWVRFGVGAAGSYTPVPNTLALRNNTGRTQVTDPIEPLDAVNQQTLIRELARSGTNVVAPEIIAPTENSTIQSLSFTVTVTPIQLVAGGLPVGIRTYWRVVSDDGLTLLNSGSGVYTTTPEINLPGISVGMTVQVFVRHEDEVEGTSQWSAPRKFRMASVLLNKVPFTYPARNATKILPNSLTVKVASGAWTDGSTFSGSKTRVRIYTQSTNTLVWDSGLVTYATSFTVPTGILQPQTGYWGVAQHVAASAPAANPSANLTSPAYNMSDMEATTFTTIAPTAPVITALKHTIPSIVFQGTQKSFTISGATSADSGTVTYNLTSITGGLSFSKTTGITSGETIQMFVPTLTSGSQIASVGIVARSSFGANASTVTAQVTIVSQKQFVFVADQLWQSPYGGVEADIECGGGGSGSATHHLNQRMQVVSGAGGGYARKRITLSVQTYQIYVGKGGTAGFMTKNNDGSYSNTPATDGGTSSFGGNICVASGGVAAKTTGSYGGGTGGKGVTGSVLFNGADGMYLHDYGYKIVSAYSGGGGGAGSTGNGSAGEIFRGSTISAGAAVSGGAGGGGSVGDSTVRGVNGAQAVNSYGVAAGGKAGVGGGGGGVAFAGGTNLYLGASADGGRGVVIVTLIL